MNHLKQKARVLLVELEGLREGCTKTNSIGMFSLLHEVLKDASELAHGAIEHKEIVPLTLEQRSKNAVAAARAASVRSDDIVTRSRMARARSNAAIERMTKVLNRERVFA